MTHAHSRYLTVLVVAFVLATAGGPIVATAAPTPAGASTPTSSPPTSTPVANGTETPAANGSTGGGGFLAGLGNTVAQGIVTVLQRVGVEQPVAAAENMTVSAVRMAAGTTHAEGVRNWFQDPQNGLYPELWDWYDGLGRAGYWFTAFIGLGLGLAATVTGFFSRAEAVEWRRRWLFGSGTGFVAWEFANLYLMLIDVMKQGFVVSPAVDSPLAALTTSGMVLALALILGWYYFSVLLALLVVVVGSTVGIQAGLPFLGIALAARGIPVPFIYGPAQKLTRAWAILPLATLPMALLLSFALSLDPAGLAAKGDIDGAVFSVFYYVAAVGFAVASPLLVWTGVSSTGRAGIVGYAVGDQMASRKFEKMKETARSAGQRGKQAANGVRDTTRGARGKAPVSDGGRGYDVGQAVRQTGSGLRPSRSPDGGVRNRLRRARSGSSSTTDDGLSERVQNNERVSTLAELTNDENQ